MKLHTKIISLNKVGKALEKRLKRLQIETVRDLLFYFPFRYEDYSTVVDIQDLRDGMDVTIRTKIELIANKRSPRKRMIITEAVVADGTGQARIVWFGQPFIKNVIHVGDEVFFSGKVKEDMFGVQMVGPVYEKIINHKSKIINQSTTHTARIVPMYSLTSGITQKQLRFLMSQVIDLAGEIKEWLPEEILERGDLMPLAEAMRAIHFPEDGNELKHAERRMKFDELYILQLRGEMIRQSVQASQAPKLKFKQKEIKDFVDSLPFTLTKAQKVASWEILQDLEKEHPMNRLLEGDVGSGKTVVAAMGLYSAVLNGYQAVLMAPTEILAKQHFESLGELFGDEVKIGLLTRSECRMFNMECREKSAVGKKREMHKNIADGKVDILVGTHAILSEKIEFKDLGFVIIDEQHRFGVEQRKTIREKSGDKNTMPHFLSMTATPIPRSFALTLYGDLDLSIVNEMPPGRKPVKTRAVDPHNRQKAYDFIREQTKQGRQVFVICPLIDSEQGTVIGDQKKSVLSEYKKLSDKVFPDLKIGYLHGKMKPAEKDATMEQFNNGTINILVSTSVIEVGVNIPNASVMMIEGAERFGLAQLHQFRGRVGRSNHQSYCFLFTDNDSDKVLERLKFFESTNDGFKVAEYDLEMRGPGEVYGTSQSGMMNMRFAKTSDKELIRLARDLARGIDFDKFRELKEHVKEWEEKVHLE